MTAFDKAWEVVKGKTGDPAEDGCSKCGVKGDDVHECWNCDKHLCIDCDPGEMRSDFDGHTYCDKCGPDGAKGMVKASRIIQGPLTICPTCGTNLRGNLPEMRHEFESEQKPITTSLGHRLFPPTQDQQEGVWYTQAQR